MSTGTQTKKYVERLNGGERRKMSRLRGASKVEHFGVTKLSGICLEYENPRKYQCDGLTLIEFWVPTKAALSLHFSAGQMELALLDMEEVSANFLQNSPL